MPNIVTLTRNEHSASFGHTDTYIELDNISIAESSFSSNYPRVLSFRKTMDKMLTIFAAELASLDARGRDLIARIGAELMHERPSGSERLYAVASVGECVLRSAAIVEQTFLGITRRLWDDPFEWTLPEKLSTPALVTEYLDEVAEATHVGLSFLTSDDDLHKEMPSPERLRTIFEILLDTIARAEHFQGKAAAILETIDTTQTFRR
jgi:hypothetical protein